MDLTNEYIADCHTHCNNEKEVIVENLFPVFNDDEKKSIKNQIEQNLFDIFKKYT